MTLALMAIGLVLVIEGLAFALAPLRIEDALRWLQDMAVERRRGFGLAMVTAGVVLVWLGRLLGG
jgi:uncharacterized protein